MKKDFVEKHVENHVGEEEIGECPLCDEGISHDDEKLGKISFRGSGQEGQSFIISPAMDPVNNKEGIAAFFVYDKKYYVKESWDNGKTWSKMKRAD